MQIESTFEGKKKCIGRDDEMKRKMLDGKKNLFMDRRIRRIYFCTNTKVNHTINVHIYIIQSMPRDIHVYVYYKCQRAELL